METVDLDPHCVYPPQFRTQYWVVPYLMAPKFSSVTVVLNSGWKEEQGRERSEKCPQLILIHTSLCLHMPFETSPRQSHTNIITETVPSWETCCPVSSHFYFSQHGFEVGKGIRHNYFSCLPSGKLKQRELINATSCTQWSRTDMRTHTLNSSHRKTLSFSQFY